MTSHKWSGWPGAYCLNCGCEHALENAMGRGWFSIDEKGQEHWKSEKHKEYVILCDSWCEAKTPADKMLEIQSRRYALGKEIGEAKPCPKCGSFDLAFELCLETGIEAVCPHCGWTSLDAPPDP